MAAVSIIIPTYNRTAFITRAVESALRQDAGGLDIVVVDDGSTDGTRQALDPYRDRVRYVWQANGGPAKARNTGLAVSRGAYVVFLDSDDALYPGAVKLAVDALEAHPAYDAAYGRALNVDVEGRAVSEWRNANGNGNLLAAILRGQTLQLGQCVFRAARVNGVCRFDEQVPFGHEDLKFFLAFCRTARWLFLDAPFVARTLHAQMITPMKSGDLVQERLRAIEDVFGEEAAAVKRRYITRPVLADWYRSDGFQRAEGGSMALARALMRNSLRQWPFQPDLYGWLLYQVLPQPLRQGLRRVARTVRGRHGTP